MVMRMLKGETEKQALIRERNEVMEAIRRHGGYSTVLEAQINWPSRGAHKKQSVRRSKVVDDLRSELRDIENRLSTFREASSWKA